MPWFPFEIHPHVLILSSRAGAGNERVAEALRIRLNLPPESHHRIEDLIGKQLKKRHFDRHRFLCQNFPSVIGCIHGSPISYRFKFLRETRDPQTLKNLSDLERTIRNGDFRTVIAANHRAAFWAAMLRQSNRIQTSLFGLVTDFAFSQGWIQNLWNQIDGFAGPPDLEGIPKALLPKFKPAPMATHPDFDRSGCKPKGTILVTGGGWGLGPIDRVALKLSQALPSKTIHIACGDNTRLFARLTRESVGRQNLKVHGWLPTLADLMRDAAAVITRPGASTLAEAHAAGTRIFLLPGLPVIEEANARHAVRVFGAETYTTKRVWDWLEPAQKSSPRPITDLNF